MAFFIEMYSVVSRETSLHILNKIVPVFHVKHKPYMMAGYDMFHVKQTLVFSLL
jgi:hypothetical protein